MGVPRTPTAQLAARGSWRGKVRDDEPQPPIVTEIDPPSSLKGRRARKIWRELAPLLVATGVLSVADLAGFERYCRLFAAWEEAMTAVEEEANRENILALTKLDDMVRRLEKGYGLTPAHRASIVAVKPKTEAGKERFFPSGS